MTTLMKKGFPAFFFCLMLFMSGFTAGKMLYGVTHGKDFTVEAIVFLLLALPTAYAAHKLYRRPGA